MDLFLTHKEQLQEAGRAAGNYIKENAWRYPADYE